MKKLSLLMMLAFLSLSFVLPQSAMAALNPVNAEMSVSPASKGLTKKEKRKRIRQLRKEYRKEMRGMDKSEKKIFLAKQLDNPTQSQEVPHKNLLIIALIFLLASIILGLILNSYIFYFIGIVLLVVWLVLFLIDYL